MLTIELGENYNGKAVMECFGHVELYDPEHVPGKVVNCTLYGVSIGLLKIMALRRLNYDKVRDFEAFSSHGLPAVQLCAILKSKAERMKVNVLEIETMPLQYLVLKQEKRNIEYQEQLLLQWWTKQKQ